MVKQDAVNKQIGEELRDLIEKNSEVVKQLEEEE